MQPQLIRELVALLGPKAVLSQAEDLMLYEYDGSVELGSPECIVFPGSTREVAEIVRLAKKYETPLVGRGAGTGLSGGAIARNGGIVISFSRMNRILEVEIVRIGGKTIETPGYDLCGLLVGSEGTLALVTEITVRLTRKPEAVKTLLAVYDTLDDTTETVVDITVRAITPAACEMLDGFTLRAVEDYVHAGFPKDCAAVLLIEVEGLTEAVEAQAAAITEVCLQHRAREVRVARDDRERELLWKGRKNAFGALGRLSPMYYVQDGVIPRTRLPETLRCIEEVSRKYDLQIGNIFHAGDGNLHPLILFDERDPEQFKRVTAAGLEIMRHCVAVGGALTGEHGVGMEKNELMPLMFTPEDLDLMRRVRAAFNPAGRLNPGKVLPLGKACGEIRVQPMPVSSTVPA